MNSLTTPLNNEAVAAFTHIYLALDLLDAETKNEEVRSYLTIIRKNSQRLQQFIQICGPANIPPIT